MRNRLADDPGWFARSSFWGTLLLSLALFLGTARGEKITFLTPAPSTLPVFAVHQLAQARGYFAAEGLEVAFQTAKGGADAAKQVAVGNAELGGGVGETSMIVRPNGLPVKGVALLGGGSLFRVAVRPGLGVQSLKDLRGRAIGVSSYQDTSFYTLKGALAANGLAPTEVDIQAHRSGQLAAQMIRGGVDAIMCTPDWEQVMEEAGLKPVFFSIERDIPAMAQAVLASDDLIKTRPQVVRGAVRAMIRAMHDVIVDPAAAARDYVKAVPEYADQESKIAKLLARYAELVFATSPPSQLGKFDPERLRKVQDVYLKNEIITKAVPIGDLYTNEFVPDLSDLSK